MAKKAISITLEPEVIEKIETRSEGSSISAIIERDLGRLYSLLSGALKTTELSIAEACAIVDVCNGWLILNVQDAQFLYANIEDADKLDGLGKKWKIDAQALAKKLKTYSLLQNLAIVDAAERFWSGPYRGVNFEEAVKEVFKI